MRSKIYFIALLLLYNNVFVESTERSVSTSIAGMAELLETEEAMVESLSRFADTLEEKLNTIRSAISKTRSELKKAKLNVEAYLSNPINSFSLIRRMHADWINWIYYIQQPIGVEHVKALESQLLKMPTQTDLVEAVNAIGRLQNTYGLKIVDMASGLLNGKQYDVRFSAIDSYTIGYELFKQERYFEASHWIYESLQSYVDSVINTALGFTKQKVIELYAELFVKQNRFKEALLVIDNALMLNPTDVNLLRRKMEIELEKTTNKMPPYVRISAARAVIKIVKDFKSSIQLV